MNTSVQMLFSALPFIILLLKYPKNIQTYLKRILAKIKCLLVIASSPQNIGCVQNLRRKSLQVSFIKVQMT